MASLRTNVAAGLLSAWLGFATGPAHAADWKRLDSEHFTLYTERDTSEAQDLLRQLEHLNWLGRKYLGANDRAPAARARFAVYELRGRIALHKLFSNLHDQVAGVYSFCAEGAVAYTVQGAEDNGFISLGQTVLQHEYAHHLMFSHASVAYPDWFVEGFAEYLSQTGVKADRLIVGTANSWRLGERWIPLEDLLGWQRLSAERRKADLPAFYAMSWLLAHFMLTDDGRAARLPAYFDRVGRDENPVAAFEAVFGLTMAELSGQLRQYQRRMSEISVPLKALPVPEIRATPLPADVDQYLLDESRLRSCVHHDKKLGPVMLERLRLHAALPAASPELRLAAARAELTLGSAQAARALIEPLLQGQADNPDAQYLWGRTWATLAATLPADAQPEAWAQARAALLQAYRLRKNDPPTLYHLAQVLQRDGVDRNVLNAARGARALAPSVRDYAWFEVQLDIAAGDREAALKALQPLMSNPHDPAAAARVRKAIEALRAGHSAAEVAAALAAPKEAAPP